MALLANQKATEWSSANQGATSKYQFGIPSKQCDASIDPENVVSDNIVTQKGRLEIRIFRCQKCEMGFNDRQMLKIHQLLDLRCTNSTAQAWFQNSVV